jgi:choice-of-anchor B domain-containing protein
MLKQTILSFVTLLFTLTATAQLNINLSANYVFPPSRGECSDIWGYVDQAGNEYAIVGNQSGVAIVDVTTPTNPVEVFYSAGSSTIWRDIKVWQNTAYITNEGSGGLKIIDLSNLPGAITPADVYNFSGSTYPFNSAHNIFIDENGLGFVCGADNGIGGAIILDLATNPLAPIELGRYNDYYLHDLFVRGDTLWGGAIYDGFFVVVDISNPAAPTTMVTQTTPDTFTHNCWLSDDGKTVFTTDEISGAFIASYDVSDIFNITELDRVQSNPGSDVIPHNVFVLNDFVVTAYYRDGITIHDVSSPSNIVEVGNYDTSPSMSGDGFNGVWGVYPYLPSGIVIASDIEKGLFVFDATYSPAAFLNGNVTALISGSALNNVLVEIVATTSTANTDGFGDYESGIATAGSYNVTFSKAGYISQTINNVVLTNGATTVLDVQLQEAVTFTFQGQVIDSNNNPIIDAKVKLTDSNTGTSSTVTTNGLGNFSVSNFYEGIYNVTVGKWAYNTICVNGQSLLSTGGPYIYQLEDGYSDDFSLDLGWAVSGNPSTGDWVREEPDGTTYNGNPSNPGNDSQVDCGLEAYITGNAGGSAGNDDIDDGETVITSPVFDLSTYTNPYVHFDRWFFNAGGQGSPNDSMVIELGNGTSTVILDIAINNDPDEGTWVSKSYRILDFLTPTSTMQLKARAMDVGPGHISEAGFDVFLISDSTIVGIESHELSEINIYPSPFNEDINIKLNGSFDRITVEVFEMTTGKKVDSREFEGASLIQLKSKYARGVYLINIFGDGSLLTSRRLIKI